MSHPSSTTQTFSNHLELFTRQIHRLNGHVVDPQPLINEVEAGVLAFAQTGSHVWLSDENPLRFALAYFALLDRGLCPIPISIDMPIGQRSGLQAQIPAGGVLRNACAESLSSSLDAAPPTDPRSYACLTSGTTSRPRLCHLSVDGAIENARAHATSLGITPEHLLIQALPVHHSFGLIAYLWTSLAVGCAIDFNSLAPSLKLLAERYDASGVVHLSPAQLRFFARMKTRPVPRISIVSVGGGAISPAEVNVFAELFPHSSRFATYGLTEAGPRVTTGKLVRNELAPLNHAGCGSHIGRALPGVQLWVQAPTPTNHSGTGAAASTHLLHEGEGLLCVQSPSLKLNLDAHELAAPGVLLTRDRVRIENGEVTYLGREQDIIKSGGISIYPADIEAAALRCAGVIDCVVLKKSDPLYEEVAVLVAEGELSVQALADFLVDHLTPAQIPKDIYVLPMLPRQSLNKVDRLALIQKLGLDGHSSL